MQDHASAVPGLPEPVAQRLRRPSWRDPRLAVGVLLVVGSVMLGSWAVRSAGNTVAVYAVAATVTAGQEILPEELVAVDVRLGDDLGRYYTLADGPPSGLVALRTVGDRELLARSAVGAAGDLNLRLVAVPVTEVLSSAVAAGSLVDLWLVPAQSSSAGGEQPDDPTLLASALVVAEVSERGSGLMSGGSPSVQVLVPVDELPGVLVALAGDGSVSIIPVPGTSS